MTSFTLMFLICRLPSSCRDMRGSFPSRLTPSFSQLTEGMGSPDAWHFNSATVSTPSVWLDGPWRMMGGGLSVSTAGQRQKREHISLKLHGWCLTVKLTEQNHWSYDHKMHWGWMWVTYHKVDYFLCRSCNCTTEQWPYPVFPGNREGTAE